MLLLVHHGGVSRDVANLFDANGIAGVVLVLKHLGIISGSIESFNFVLPPRPETLERAVEVLEAAGAVG